MPATEAATIAGFGAGSVLCYYLLQHYGESIHSFLETFVMCKEVFTLDEIIRNIDRFIIQNKIFSSRLNDEVPGDGIHWVARQMTGVVFFVKKTTRNYNGPDDIQYTIWTFTKSSMEKILALMLANDTNFMHCYIINSANPWTHELNKMDIIPGGYKERKYVYQQDLLEQITNKFEEKQNCLVLISGKPGTGKSAMGEIVHLEKLRDGTSSLVHGFSCCSAGLKLDSILTKQRPTKKTPVILMLDEIDQAFKKTVETNKQPSHHPSIADDKGTMNSFLDHAAKTPFLIVIATTNDDLDDIKKTYPAYYRRFNITKTFK